MVRYNFQSKLIFLDSLRNWTPFIIFHFINQLHFFDDDFYPKRFSGPNEPQNVTSK